MKSRQAGFFVDAEYGHRVYAEHERFHSWVDISDVANGFDYASLYGRSVYNSEQRIDIVQKQLPKTEDLGWLLKNTKHGY
jgi:hypothetical protein